ncbi:unnamed protein product [Cuscuta epithymum]|uniref:Uncharacterized protein n=1 Tax=Cuscuta epithymum TaxID=186058 RepID=A0AAV0EC67_9ASTE|nr:unnamed protein product [Cuscuta epithymum]
MSCLQLEALPIYRSTLFCPKPKALHSKLILNPCKSHLQSERGLQFDVGDTFFRRESATGRDLGVLSAALRRNSEGSLRVLDAMCGCGIRSLRYLEEANADFVLANDANDAIRDIILGNLSRVSRDSSERRDVTHSDATRVLTECYLKRDYFDFIDVDSFGSDSSYLRAAVGAVKFGGMLYVTNTDGYSSGGNRPRRCLAAYGAYVQRMPYSNEIGLRMLIGGVIREALTAGHHVVPLFSYYSYHGPVFRVLLKINNGLPSDQRHYGFVSYCGQCGDSRAFPWEELGKVSCSCIANVREHSLAVSGPVWTGPLHKESHLREMLNLANEWGWIGNDTGRDLEKLLNVMIDECDPNLPVGYTKVDEIASRAKVNSPPLNSILTSLQKRGYTASRSHIASNAIKTNCRMGECVRIVKELQQPG